MTDFQVSPIGIIQNNKQGTKIQLESRFIPALKGLEGFRHINVIWWFSNFDSKEARSVLEVPKPYKNAPEQMGIFATRSPVRPNPIALSTAEVLYIDYQKGTLFLPYIDAHDNTPVLDIKPYTPSLDRIENPQVPQWCSHWPKSLEQSADFPWEDQFNF